MADDEITLPAALGPVTLLALEELAAAAGAWLTAGSRPPTKAMSVARRRDEASAAAARLRAAGVETPPYPVG